MIAVQMQAQAAEQKAAPHAPVLLVQPCAACGRPWNELAAREGLYYEAIEFYMPPVSEAPSDRERTCTWYRSSGRSRALHGAFVGIDPASGDEQIRTLSQMRCRESCELALMLGAERIVFHSSAFPFLRGAYLDNWVGLCAEFYMALAAEYRELTVCIESSQDLDPEPLEALIGRTDGRVRVCLDIGHARYSGTPLPVWFERLGSRIACLHLSDNHGRFDDHLPLGAGSVDWTLADRLWRQLGGELPLTLEVGGLHAVEQSLTYLKQHGYFGLEA